MSHHVWGFSTAVKMSQLYLSAALTGVEEDLARQAINDWPSQPVFRDSEPPLQYYDISSPCDLKSI